MGAAPTVGPSRPLDVAHTAAVRHERHVERHGTTEMRQWQTDLPLALFRLVPVRLLLKVSGIGRAIHLAADRTGVFLDNAQVLVRADEAG